MLTDESECKERGRCVLGMLGMLETLECRCLGFTGQGN